MEYNKNSGKQKTSLEELSEQKVDIGLPSTAKVYAIVMLIMAACLSVILLFMYGAHIAIESINGVK